MHTGEEDVTCEGKETRRVLLCSRRNIAQKKRGLLPAPAKAKKKKKFKEKPWKEISTKKPSRRGKH